MSWIEQIKNYNPYNEQEKKDKEMFLYFIDTFKDILTRTNEIVHVTTSAFVLNKERDKALMVYHNIYDSWSWAGGHADGEKDLLMVAMNEVREETGVRYIKPVFHEIFALDVLPVIGHIKRGKYVSAHLHLSVTFLLEADEKDQLIVKEDENSAVKWIPLNKIIESSSEPHMKVVYGKILSKSGFSTK